MVRVALQVGHPAYESSRRFEVALPQLPRAGEYIRADEPMLRGAGVDAWADLWNVLAVVHERPTEGVEATLHVVPADMSALYHLFGDKPGPPRR
jgi:hypothetical protein